LRTSTRERKPPSHLNDYYCYLVTSDVDNGVKHPISKHLSYNSISLPYKHFILIVTSNIEPKSFQEAIQQPCWQQAIQDELSALQNNATLSLCPLPKGKRKIGSKWVFKTKFKADGTLERHKARLVAKGYNQTEGIDFKETFSPEVKMTTVRVILALAACNNWNIDHLDVNSAFLNGDLDEDVYMAVPQVLTGTERGMVCKLHKSLYGLK
jgi:hypothetical protein